MRAKTTERLAARELRAEGWSYKRIAAELGVSVASVHAWASDVELSREQHLAILRHPHGPQSAELIARRSAARSAKARAARLEHQAEGRRRARARDPLHRDGCMLYWAEGSKDCNAVKFSNSDIDMTVRFCRFLRTSMGIEPAAIGLSLNVYTNNGVDIAAIEQRWLGALELTRCSLRKHILNHTPTSSSGRSRRRLVYGVATLAVTRTWAVQHIYGAIQEYAGIERPEWLEPRWRTLSADS